MYQFIRNIICKAVLAVNWKVSMKKLRSKVILKTLFVLALSGYAELIIAHSGGGVLDPNGNNAGATDMAIVSCSGGTAYLEGQIKDMSAPVANLLLSFHIYQGLKMATSTDYIAGDSSPSPAIQVWGGDVNYFISATKTAAGARLFEATWHCKDAAGNHTETALSVVQVQ